MMAFFFSSGRLSLEFQSLLLITVSIFIVFGPKLWMNSGKMSGPGCFFHFGVANCFFQFF
jgi:hypothetical protein